MWSFEAQRRNLLVEIARAVEARSPTVAGRHLETSIATPLEAEGLDTYHAIIEATVQRARPVILTALAAALAFIPLTHSSFWGALAYVLIGGVGAGTVLTLLFLPALYALWFKVKQPAPTSITPVASGSRVPAWPTLRSPRARLTQPTTS